MSQPRPQRRAIEQESNLSSPILKLARSLLCIKPLLVYLFTIFIAGTGFPLEREMAISAARFARGLKPTSLQSVLLGTAQIKFLSGGLCLL